MKAPQNNSIPATNQRHTSAHRWHALAAVTTAIAIGLALAACGAATGPVASPRTATAVRPTHHQFLVHARNNAVRLSPDAARRAKLRRLWLKSPAARRQRLRSRAAFEHLAPAASKRLLVHSFNSTLRRIGRSPAASVAAKGRVIGYKNDYNAIVMDRRGRRLLESSTTPLRADGGPVDPQLRQTGSTFVQRRSANAITISRHLDDGVSILHTRFTLQGADATGSLSSDNTVFYPEVAVDTDATVTPTAAGMDLSTVLRSRRSPQELAYLVDLPTGLSLKRVARGAGIFRGSTQILSIPAPIATDAQGSSVAASMSVQGNRLEISVRHRRLDVAYPILVDPLVTDQSIMSAPGWSFVNCTGNPNIVQLGVASIELEAGTYGPDDCAEWVWNGAAAGVPVGGIFSIEDSAWGQTGPGLGPFLYGPTGPGIVTPAGEYGSPGCVDDLYSPGGWTNVFESVNTDAPQCGSGFFFGFSTDGRGELVTPHEPFTQSTAVAGYLDPILITAEITASSALGGGSGGTGGSPGGGGGPSPAEWYGAQNPGEPNQTRACSGDPVDCATGNLFETQTDIALRGRGLPFSLVRSYNSHAAAAGQTSIFGAGWSTSFGQHLSFDDTDQTITVTQANGSTTTFSNADGYILPVSPLTQATLAHNSDGTYSYTLPDQETDTFDSAGHLLTETDRYGNALTCAYNAANQLTRITDDAGRSIDLTYATDGSGRVTQASGPMGVVSYHYDDNGNLTRVTNLDGKDWTFAYDASHQLTSATDPAGNTTTNTYDSSNRVVSQTDGANRTRTWAYPAAGQTTITNPGGDQVNEHFDDNGLPTSITRGYGTSSASTTSIAYDLELNPAKVTDGNGQTWAYAYDDSGNLSSITDPSGDTTQLAHNDNHDPTSLTDPAGRQWTYTYNDRRLISITETGAGQGSGCGCSFASTRVAQRPDEIDPQFGYDDQGDVTSLTDDNGNTWHYGYNAAGNMTSETAPGGEKTTWSYDASGYPTSQTSPNGNSSHGDASQHTTVYGNDPFGRPTSVLDPLGRLTTMSYDGDGNLTSSTSPDNHTTSYTYDGASELTTTTRPDGTTQTSSYDPDGHVASQTDGADHTTTYSYNPLGQVATNTDPLNRTTSYDYDQNGNLITVTDAQGRTTDYGYDPANRITSIHYSDGTPNVTYGYDAAGDRTAMTDGSGTSSYSYDPLGRLESTTDGAGNTIGYTHDPDGNTTSITYPDGHKVDRAFDTDGRLTSVTDWLGNQTKFGYDADSNLTTTTFPSTTSDVDSYRYDNADQLAGIHMKQGGSTLASLSYIRNADGLLAADTGLGLPSPPTQPTDGYSYDPADNPTQLDGNTGYNYDDANELTSSPTQTDTYNQLGARTSATTTGSSPTTYAYDQASRLTNYTSPVGTTTFGYNGDGLRTTTTAGATMSSFAWDQTGTLPDLLNDSRDDYIYGPDGIPIEQIDGDGTPSYLHHDQLGSTRLITAQNGSTTGEFTYSPSGALISHTGTADTPLRWAGQYQDPETGLVYLRARYYDPQTAQFLTRDPAEQITRQPYAYAADNPLNHVDPSGLDWLGVSWLPSPGDVVGFAGSAVATGIKNSPPGELLQVVSSATGDTLGGCIGGNLDVIVSGSGSLCYIATPSGRSAITATLGGGAGSLGASGFIGALISNGQTPSDQCGGFSYAGGSIGRGLPSGGGSVAVGKNGNGNTIVTTTVGWTPNVGLPVPFTWQGGQSNTWVASNW